jgi:hypothetical protein
MIAGVFVVLLLAAGQPVDDLRSRISGDSVTVQVRGRSVAEASQKADSNDEEPAEVRFISGCTPVGGPAAVLDCLNTPCPDGTVRGTVLDLSPSTGSAERPVIDRFSDGCFGGGDPAVFEAVVAARFQESVTPSRAVVQPATGRALVNLPLVAYAEPVTDTWTPTLLGTPVTIRATPVSYVWDFGDGSASVVTDHPGGPYPDHAAEHTYRTTGDRIVTLTTTYTGHYSVDGGASWLAIGGEARASSAPIPVRLVEARAQLTG